jgi:peptide/nickel transport system permease protein
MTEIARQRSTALSRGRLAPRLAVLREQVASLPAIPVILLAAVVLMGVLAPVLAPYDPNEQNLFDRLLPPAWNEGGEWSHPLGTDRLGRDVLSRLIYGSRASLAVGFTVIAIAGSIGCVLALWSGYVGGWADHAIMRLTDAVMSMPFLVVALALASLRRPSLGYLIVILGALGWANYARVLRSEVLRLRASDFVLLARIAGAGRIRILYKHVLPNIANTLIVLATLQLGATVIAAASLDFLGLGVPATTPTWGAMLSDGRANIRTAWWLATFPGIIIMLTVLSINLLGDWLRVRLDPRHRGM